MILLTAVERGAAQNGSPQGWKNVSCGDSAASGSGTYTDMNGYTHDIGYQNYGHSSADSSGGFYDAGHSSSTGLLPQTHSVAGTTDSDEHWLNGTLHTDSDLDYNHAFNMFQDLLNTCIKRGS